MHSIVLIKQVPEMERVVFDQEKGVIDRSSAGTQINPFDLHAIEAALQLRKQQSGSVSAISMGPPSAETALREALARGCDEAYLAGDKQFAGADVKATAMVLAKAIQKVGYYDLILAGMQTVDGDTGQVGPEVAEYLGIPHASYVEEIVRVEEGHILVKSGIWEGQYLIRLKLPALITVTKDVNIPELPLLSRKIGTRRQVIHTLRMEDINLTEAEVGLRGSPTQVKKVVVKPAASREGVLFRTPTEEMFRKIGEVLYDK